jgi:hypothetical protein
MTPPEHRERRRARGWPRFSSRFLVDLGVEARHGNLSNSMMSAILDQQSNAKKANVASNLL